MATTMTISLPEPMRRFIESEVEKGEYGSASELFREMVRERQKRQAQEQLEMLLLGGLESGEPIDVNADYLKRHRRGLLTKLTANPKNK